MCISHCVACYVLPVLCGACYNTGCKSIGIIIGRVLPRKTAAPLFLFFLSRVAALFFALIVAVEDPMQRRSDRGDMQRVLYRLGAGSVQRCEIVKRFSLVRKGFQVLSGRGSVAHREKSKVGFCGFFG